MGYLHVEVEGRQLSKKAGKVCGDVFIHYRDKSSTIVILSDGLGSGIKANIAATMCVTRLKELIKSGYSVRHAFTNLVETMENARKNDLPYAVFTVARILNDGVSTVLTYEMPPPVFVSKKYSSVLKQRTHTINNSIIGEAGCYLNPNEGILLMSDGITQSGLGTIYPSGWESKGVVTFINDFLINGNSKKILPQQVLGEALNNWGNKVRDDLTAVFINSRKGRVINLFTGPPADKKKDTIITEKFMNQEGVRIVCGASTAKIVAREINQELRVNDNYASPITPPSYEIDGINLVTEGAVTLTQLYNIWKEDPSILDKHNPVTELRNLLDVADKVNIFLGTSENPADEDINFKQTGILSRKVIIPLLAEKLRNEGKLVIVEEI